MLLKHYKYFLLIQALPVIVIQLCFINSNFFRVDAAHSRRRVAYRRDIPPSYDREITTFSEDGRLAQVEYGLESSFRGSTIGAIKVPSELLNANADCDQRSDSEDEEEREGMLEGKSIVCICIENSSFGKMHRIDDHIWMLTAGLSGDARMLANRLRIRCQNHRFQYGEQPSLKQAARMSADIYHQLTRLGGVRPIGCTCMMIGISNEYYCGAATTKIFLIDPICGVEERQVCTAGNAQIDLKKELSSLVFKFDRDNNDNNNAESNDDTNIPAKSTSCVGRGRRSRTSKSITSFASLMANKFLMKLDETETKSNIGSTVTTIDVWTIQPKKNCRGGMLATCYSGVQIKNMKDIFKE